MAERVLGQLSLADGVLRAAPGNAVLERIAGLIDWKPLEQLLAPLRQGHMGAPGYPALPLFKALLLQQWYCLSDPALEESIADRLSFRRFMGLALADPVPDHSTIWRFRETLGKSGLAEQAFAAITCQIEQSGFVLKRGTLIDASLIPSAVNPPPPPAELLPPDETGRPASKLVKHPRDPQAGWTTKQGSKKRCYGYKLHVAMDQGSRIVRRLLLTPANINETVPADDLIIGDERRVFADKAYDSHRRRSELLARGIRNGIMRRAARCHSLSRWAKLRNTMLRVHRAPIEPLFALIKHVYGFARAHYLGLERNSTALHLACAAMNLKRWATA
jgi:IS5 family transposase